MLTLILYSSFWRPILYEAKNLPLHFLQQKPSIRQTMISMPSTCTNAPLAIRAICHSRRQGSVQTVEIRKKRKNKWISISSTWLITNWSFMTPFFTNILVAIIFIYHSLAKEHPWAKHLIRPGWALFWVFPHKRVPIMIPQSKQLEKIMHLSVVWSTSNTWD